MPTQIKPNRPEVSRAFPILGFTIRTGVSPMWFELALATRPELLYGGPADVANRQHTNFWSSRVMGPLAADRGEAVFLVPPPVLARFVGQEKLHYGLATYRQPDFQNPDVTHLPVEAVPYVRISRTYTGNPRGVTGLTTSRGNLIGNSYTNDSHASLVWGGDVAAPGEIVAVNGPVQGSNGNGRRNGNGKTAESPAEDVPASSGMAFDYDDGFDKNLWLHPQTSARTTSYEPHYGMEQVVQDDRRYAVRSAARAMNDLGLPPPRVDVLLNVALVPQTDKLSCWAASMSMLISYRQQASVLPERLAQAVGRSLRTSYGWDMLEEVKNRFGFLDITLPSNTSLYPSPDQWYAWLDNYGPLWVTVMGAPSHAIIVDGIRGDLTPAATEIHVLNPWDLTTQFSNDPIDFNPPNQGLAEWLTFDRFAADFGLMDLVDYGHWRVLHLPATPAATQPFSRQTSPQRNEMRAHNRKAPHPVRAQSRALSSDSFDVNWNDVQLVPQFTGMSCWAAAAAMVVGWRDRVSIDPAEVARGSGHWAAYTNGLNPNDVGSLAQAWGLISETPQSYTIDGLRRLIDQSGPLWVAEAVPSLHAIVVQGIYGDGTLENTYVRILDPWPPEQGERYDLPLSQFISQYEGAAGAVPLQILHSGSGMMSSQQQSYQSRPVGILQPRNGGTRPASAQTLRKYEGRTRALSGESFDINWSDAQLIPQFTGMSCWAASAAMVVGWREQMSINPEEIARGAGFLAEYQHGLNPSNRDELARAWGLVMEPPVCYTVEGFRQLLENNGPLWVGVAVPSGHAVVASGLYGDGTPEDTFVRVLDPWPPGEGSTYSMRFTDFMQEYEDRMTVDPAGNVNVQILHANGRRPVSTQQGLSSTTTRRPANDRPRSRALVAPIVVPIASAIVGATMARITNNEGDVSWELDKLDGLKYPFDDPANRGDQHFQDHRTRVEGLAVENLIGDRLGADFEIRWQSNGRSLGNIEIIPRNANDMVGGALHIQGTISNDANVYTNTQQDESFAAVNVHLEFRFTRPIGADVLGYIRYKLYGSGGFDIESDWTQQP